MRRASALGSAPKVAICPAFEARPAAASRPNCIIVAVEDRDAPAAQAPEKIRPSRRRWRRRRKKNSRMDGRDRRDDRNMRARHAGQRRDLAADLCRSRSHRKRYRAACGPAAAARPNDCCRRQQRHASARLRRVPSAAPPKSRASPSVAGNRPVSIFIVVVLPQPFEPRKPNISPRSIERST